MKEEKKKLVKRHKVDQDKLDRLAKKLRINTVVT